MIKELRIVNGWFLDNETGSKPVCAFKKETFCTPDCIACRIDQKSMESVKATCLRGDFVFASIVELQNFPEK